VNLQKMALYRLEWEQFLLTPLPLEDDDDFALVCEKVVEHGPSRISGGGKSEQALISLSEFSSGVQKLVKISASPDTESLAMDLSLSTGFQALDSGHLILHREKHVREIRLGNLKGIRNILAESTARMRRDEVFIIKLEAGDIMDGYGIRVFPDSSLYAGDFVGGHRHGLGILRWCNGHSYFGQWFENVAQGQGVYRFPNGDSYTGTWDRGGVIGEGSFMHDDGETFDGENSFNDM
jgi:hypothetical protein